VLGVGTFRTPTVVREVVDLGITPLDQFLADGFDDAAEVAARDGRAAPDVGYVGCRFEARGVEGRFDELALEVGAVLPLVEA
jgi:hypothetical protein